MVLDFIEVPKVSETSHVQFTILINLVSLTLVKILPMYCQKIIKDFSISEKVCHSPPSNEIRAKNSRIDTRSHL